MSKVSVLIPARNEEWLSPTVDDLFTKASGPIEVIVVLDGPTQFPVPAERPGLRVVAKTRPGGLRPAINDLAALATGDYLFKVDAHCAFAPGYDQALQADCDGDWVVIPRMHILSLDSGQVDYDPTWTVDYFYLSCPWTHPKFFQIQPPPWHTRTLERYKQPLLDETMALMGSAWFMPTRYWRETIGPLGPETRFGPYGEHLDIVFRAWLGGGRVMVNKKTWFAHGDGGWKKRGYERNLHHFHLSHIREARYWTSNSWERQVRPFEWLIEHFWPLPTEKTLGKGEVFYWPEDWQAVVRQPAPVS